MTLLNALLQNDTIKVLVLDNHKTFVDYVKEPNTIIAFTAIIVSIFGLCYSVRYSRMTLKQTIKHNKLSVEPLLNTHTFISNNNNTVEVCVQNNGLGTALIKSFMIFQNDDTFDDFNCLFKTNNIEIKDNQIRYFVFSELTYILNNTSVLILKCTVESSNEIRKVKTLFKEIKIEVKYESIYGDEKVLVLDKFMNKDE